MFHSEELEKVNAAIVYYFGSSIILQKQPLKAKAIHSYRQECCKIYIHRRVHSAQLIFPAKSNIKANITFNFIIKHSFFVWKITVKLYIPRTEYTVKADIFVKRKEKKKNMFKFDFSLAICNHLQINYIL